MTSQIYTITIDAADQRVLANFWSKLLDYRVTYDSSDQVIIEAHDEAGPAVLFIETPDTKRGKNRVHLDLNPDDQQAEVERAGSGGEGSRYRPGCRPRRDLDGARRPQGQRVLHPDPTQGLTLRCLRGPRRALARSPRPGRRPGALRRCCSHGFGRSSR